MKGKEYYDEFFIKYPSNVHDDPVRFAAVSKLLSGRVLDIACGTGTLAKYYAGDYVGIDISAVAIQKAREIRRSSATFFCSDFVRSGFDFSGKFDSIYIGEFLEHIDEDGVLFAQIRRLLKPGGLIVCSVPNGERIPDESHCRTFIVPQIRQIFSEYGQVNFHNWPGFKNRILFSITFGFQERHNLSLVMIAKNESKGIEDAIISALPFVDRVVVSVDSKSTDETVMIADNYADMTRSHEWFDDFSMARNMAQKDVITDWIIFLDGHEYIEQAPPFDELLKTDYDGILVTIRMENGFSFMYPRIFRSHLQFKNAVHNELDCKKLAKLPGFVVVHDREKRQSGDAVKIRQLQRDKMIPEIMRQELGRDRKNQRALFNLANWNMTKGEYKRAIHFYRRCVKETKNTDEKYFLVAQIGIAHQLLGRKLRATWTFFKLEAICPNRWETCRLLGGAFMEREEWLKALQYFTEALEPNKEAYLYNLFAFDLSELWDIMAFCFLRLNQNAQAKIAIGEAVKNCVEPKRKELLEMRQKFINLL
jgi:SAM-dependent methyltransferase